MCNWRLDVAAESSGAEIGAVAERRIDRSRPSGSWMTISAGPRPEYRALTG
jgi:hypothetical protein